MALTSSQHAVSRRRVDPRSLRRKPVTLFVAALAVAGVATLVIAMWLGGNLSQASVDGLLIGGTSSFTTWGLQASKLVMEVSSVGVVGMLLTRLLLPDQDGKPSPTARRCLRTASQLAVVWAISTFALFLFNWSDMAGMPVTDLPITKLFTDIGDTFPGVADFVSSTAVAVMIAVGLAVTDTRLGAMVLLPLALYNLVPMALQGHASHGTVLKYSLLVHVIVVSLWVGGLAALLMHVRKEPAMLAVAVPRFSTVALGCYVLIAASGITASWYLLGSLPTLWGSRYGVLVMLKGAALIALGVFGWWHRRHTVSRIRTGEDGRARRAFIQLAAAEVFIMVIAIALAVTLSRTASPDTIVLHGNL
ncbi:copper resistance D family protein [Amycolatopsis taiwanensis]|uniref:copper resistance D family protein n=1 Tax=Amycolatopsis taiwanensis TaxID=342230 RepID=UPI0004BBFA51|nr:CopD family protein [Amycolatopsis taiwanensis]